MGFTGLRGVGNSTTTSAELGWPATGVQSSPCARWPRAARNFPESIFASKQRRIGVPLSRPAIAHSGCLGRSVGAPHP